MDSWVKTTCPPGWCVTQVSGTAHWSVYCCEPNGPDRFVGQAVTHKAACRMAWERWALEVLGERAEWANLPSTRAAIVTRAGEVCLDEESDAPRWWVYLLRGDGVMVRDPVEALARLAALTLAVLGPEVNHG